METTTTAPLRGTLLKKVYRVWLFRRLLPVLVIETLLLAFVLYELGNSVFIQNIIENALTVFFLNPLDIFGFFGSAFTNASTPAKVLGISSALLAALFVRHISQGLLRLILVKENYFQKTS